MKPGSAAAQCIPRFAYLVEDLSAAQKFGVQDNTDIWLVNNGNAAPNRERRMEFAARTEAAYIVYESTRYEKMDIKTRRLPRPKRPPNMIGTTQWMFGPSVPANPPRPMTMSTPPTIPGGKRSSGAARPPFLFAILM